MTEEDLEAKAVFSLLVAKGESGAEEQDVLAAINWVKQAFIDAFLLARIERGEVVICDIRDGEPAFRLPTIEEQTKIQDARRRTGT